MTDSSVAVDLDQLHQAAKGALFGRRELDAREWQPALTELRRRLQQPMSLPETELLENVVKTYLRAILRLHVSGDDARFLAQWQRELGFLLKYKSYAVKCATPLGYSVFLQNPGEGFSFQRHVTRKTEIFHILEPLARALVFLCTSEEWEAIYERERFQQWLDGGEDAAFDRFAVRPNPGDVYHVSELNVIHSVLGCVLEEFATVSIDMVDRVHDQNEGRVVPHIARETVLARLRNLPACTPRLPVAGAEAAGIVIREGEVQPYRLATGEIDATRVHAGRGSFELPPDAHRARILFTIQGEARVTIRAAGDAPHAEIPPIVVHGGDLLMIVPGATTTVGIDSHAVCSIHAIEPEIALA